MGVTIGLWCSSIGCFHASYKSYYKGKRNLSPQCFTFYASLIVYLVNNANQCLNSQYSFFGFYILVFINFILLCWDIEENPVPKAKANYNLFVCRWNVNTIPSNIFQKISVLGRFVAMFESFCCNKSFLRADHSSNAKRGRVCIYDKETLALKMISIPYLNESLFCASTIGSKSEL